MHNDVNISFEQFQSNNVIILLLNLHNQSKFITHLLVISQCNQALIIGNSLYINSISYCFSSQVWPIWLSSMAPDKAMHSTAWVGSTLGVDKLGGHAMIIN
jgi:hypothetical protein